MSSFKDSKPMMTIESIMSSCKDSKPMMTIESIMYSCKDSKPMMTIESIFKYLFSVLCQLSNYTVLNIKKRKIKCESN